MRSDIVYTPGMKTKRGEMRALRELDDESVELIMPLIDVVAIPAGTGAAGVQAHLAKSVRNVVSAWPAAYEFYFDFFDIEPQFRCPRDVHPVVFTLRQLREEGLRPVPVVGLDRDRAFLRAVRTTIDGSDAVCVRLQAEDFVDAAATAANVASLISQLGAASLPLHIVLDFRSIANETTASVVARALDTYIGFRGIDVDRWIFLASGMWPSLADIKGNSIGTISRREPVAWRQIRTVAPDVVYGDYGVIHPDYVDLDPRLIKPAAKIRYASENAWVVVKGKQWSNDTTQHRRLCAALMRRPEFRNDADAWGERYMRGCADGSESCGNLERWVAVDTNVHLEHAVEHAYQEVHGRVPA